MHRQHSSAYLSIRQHTSAYEAHVSIVLSAVCSVLYAPVCGVMHTSAYVSIHQHGSAYVSIRNIRQSAYAPVCSVLDERVEEGVKRLDVSFEQLQRRVRSVSSEL
jgi:hypothetical protein